MAPLNIEMQMVVWVCLFISTIVSGYSETPKQYHIQTDDGPDRYFRFQTFNGQFRKEKRFDDGTVVGTYGWVDPLSLLRLYDYIADQHGYRIVRERTMKVPPIIDTPPKPSVGPPSIKPPAVSPSQSDLQPVELPPSAISRPLPSPGGPPGSPPQSFQRKPFGGSQTRRPQVDSPSLSGFQPVVLTPPALSRPIPPTRLRPVTSQRQVPPRVSVVSPVPQARPSSLPVTVPDRPKLKPILVPLSQSGTLSPSVVELQPVSPKPQLFFRQNSAAKMTPVPLLPVSNGVFFGKDITGRNEDTSSSSSHGTFGKKITNGDGTDKKTSEPTNTVTVRGRNRGKPLAITRQAVSTSSGLPKSSSSPNRGSVRFRGQSLPSDNNKGSAKILQPVALNPVKVPSASNADSVSSFSQSSRNSPIHSATELNNNIRKQPSTNSDSSSNFRSGVLTPSRPTTNPGVTFDLPSDLPYSINYDLGNQFHLEKILPDGTKVGKHGYVDPLGVLRVTHYATGPNGHQQKQVNRWVGTREPEVHL